MKRIWILCLCLLLSAPALAEAIAPVGEATLYIVNSGEIERHPLPFEGEAPSGEELLNGLGALTGYAFEVNNIIHAGDNLLIVNWANTASFMPGGNVPEDVEFEAMLKCMIDSAWMTLRENLGVRDIHFGDAKGNGLAVAGASWHIPADEPYNGNFAEYRDGEQTADGYSPVPELSMTGIGFDEALDAVFGKVLPALEPAQGAANWTIGSSGYSSTDGLEGRAFDIDWADSCDPYPSYRAIVRADGTIYLLKDGEKEYAPLGD